MAWELSRGRAGEWAPHRILSIETAFSVRGWFRLIGPFLTRGCIPRIASHFPRLASLDSLTWACYPPALPNALPPVPWHFGLVTASAGCDGASGRSQQAAARHLLYRCTQLCCQSRQIRTPPPVVSQTACRARPAACTDGKTARGGGSLPLWAIFDESSAYPQTLRMGFCTEVLYVVAGQGVCPHSVSLSHGKAG